MEGSKTVSHSKSDRKEYLVAYFYNIRLHGGEIRFTYFYIQHRSQPYGSQTPFGNCSPRENPIGIEVAQLFAITAQAKICRQIKTDRTTAKAQTDNSRKLVESISFHHVAKFRRTEILSNFSN